MRPRDEVEIKLEVRDPGALKRRLAELGFRVAKPRHFEANALYDFPGLDLRKSGRALRLRWTGAAELVTFKGTPANSSRYKVRPETETRIESADRLKEIFENLGLREIFRYEKFRTVFHPAAPRLGRRHQPELVYDETPIGNFVELEGPRGWIDQVARRLGYRPQDYITLSYATLYQRWCADEGIAPAGMVFRRRKAEAPRGGASPVGGQAPK